MSGGIYSLKSTPNDRLFGTMREVETSLNGNFIYSQSFCQKSAEKNSPKKYFNIFVYMSDLVIETRALRLISQHTTH